jgi:hypothetical protein
VRTDSYKLVLNIQNYVLSIRTWHERDVWGAGRILGVWELRVFGYSLAELKSINFSIPLGSDGQATQADFAETSADNTL